MGATTKNPAAVADHSDESLAALLKRVRATDSPAELRHLSHQIERVIFHKQFENVAAAQAEGPILE
jgi:hypothetical protein